MSTDTDEFNNEEEDDDGGFDGDEKSDGTDEADGFKEETLFDEKNVSGGSNVEEEAEEEKPIVEAKQIYILMAKEYRISRNRRAEWFFNVVNNYVSYPSQGEGEESTSKDGDKIKSSDFEVVSIIPKKEPASWSVDTAHKYRYHVSPDTKIIYLSRRYRIVFCLDISPSVASVDVQAGGVVFDSIFKALQASLQGLLQPFKIPGTRRTFCPEIFLTVIAHTPFFAPVTDQVLIQGQILDKDTCSGILEKIFDQLNDAENRIANLITKRVQELSLDSRENSSHNRVTEADASDGDGDDDDETDGNVFEESPTSLYGGQAAGPNPNDEPIANTTTRRSNVNKYSSFAMSPDFGLLDLLRQALIALSLMPENSSPGLVILTDGVISVPDGRYLDIILNQLRYNTVSCSFIQLSSPFHPHLCHGVLPYADLMKFIASATFGAYLSEAPEIAETGDGGMNAYHNAFLAWSFHKTLETEWTKQRPQAKVKPGEWSVRNKCFFSVRDMPIVKKQQYEQSLDVDHMKVMSCRLREGFTIKEVITSPETGLAEVTLILPWKFLIHLEYKIYINSYIYDRGLTDLAEPTYSSKVRCVVSLEGPYDFLHDVTCLAKKPFSSLYRQLMVNRFWATRKNLSESDRLLVHLNSFSANQAYYNIPESLKNGMPLFYWGPVNSSALPQLQSNEQTYPQFTHFWKPVCLLDTTVWQKWMHTHRIGVILEHDYPLPKNVHLPNSTGRFNVIQCRQAIMALNTLLKNMSSFVLVENQSYVYLMYKSPEDKVPHSFCLVRVTSKPPHVVLRLAFLVGTPGHLRHATVAQFRAKIASLTFPQRVKDPPKWRVIMNTPVAKAAATASPLVNKTSWSDMPCCVIVHKPVEKIMIRYDKSPDDFGKRLLSVDETSLYIPEAKSTKQSTFGFRPTYQTAPVVGSAASFQMLPEVFNTIARYLHHRRWIWWFPGGDLRPLNAKWASEILATVTKIRLQEGFRFAFSSAGITNMVLELPMKSSGTNKSTVAPMVLQFIVFPPTANLKSEDFDLDSVDTGDSIYLVTECWVEPQCGSVTEDEIESDVEDIPVKAKDFLGLSYTDIPDFLLKTDRKCISLVGTFEYLVRICSNKEIPFLVTVNQPGSDSHSIDDESINVIPFEFDLKPILKRSGQVEILFSSFFQDLSLTFPTEWNLSVCSFFERANSLLYQHWCTNIAVFQDKEVALSQEQHEVATRAVLKRKGLEDLLDDDDATSKSPRGPREKFIQWRCFVRSSSSTHVLVTLVPASLKDLKNLLLQLDLNVEALHKTRSSRYVDFIADMEYNMAIADAAIECPNQLGGQNLPAASSASSSSSPQLVDHHQLNCRNCQSVAPTSVATTLVNRKRMRAFSGGSECAPAIKKYLSTQVPFSGGSGSQVGDDVFTSSEEGNDQEETNQPSPPEPCQDHDVKTEDEQKSAYVRSQTFSEGTVSGKLAHFMRSKRTLSDQSASAANGGAVGGNGEQEQDNLCSDPQRCSQLRDYLNRCGGNSSNNTGATLDETLRFVPCRPPIVGSIAYCIFTYSCSLMSLTDHIVFNKVSSDQLTKDFRVFRDPLSGFVGGYGEFDQDTGDDDDELSSGSGSMFPNGRSISQESFSESSLQRLEAAEQEALLKIHCTQLRDAHLRAYIVSAYRSLLNGYSINPCDIKVVIDRCTLTRVRFPLNKFLKHICHHEKSILQVLADYNEEVLRGEERRQSTHEAADKVETEESFSSCSSDRKDCCKQLENIHHFIKKRFRRLLSRNFSPVSDDGNVFYYKISGSNAFSDVSGFCAAGGQVKCCSDMEDNIDSCSIVADSLCSADDHYPMASLQITSDNEATVDKSPGNNPIDRRSVTNVTNIPHHADHGGNTANDTDVHSFSGCTQPSLYGGATSGITAQCAPMFGYLTCAFKPVEQQAECESNNGSEEFLDESDEDETGYLRLVDLPTCYHELCLDYIRKVADDEDPEDVLDLTPASKLQLTMELTFLTVPETDQEKSMQSNSADESGSSGASQTSSRRSFRLSLAEFQKRLSLRQANAIDAVIRDINWLIEDEITSFRGGGGGPGSGDCVSKVDESLLEKISKHVLHSLDKTGCIHQQIRLSFVEHSDNKGFNSFLERFNNLAVNEYSFRQVGMWWFLVRTVPNSIEGTEENQQSGLDTSTSSSSSSKVILPSFWIILRAFPTTVLDLYHHCRFDENDHATLQFSRNLRVRIIDLVSSLIRTINQDLLLQQLHDTRVCSPFLEMEDPPDLEEASDLMMIPRALTSISKFGDSESDISSTLPLGMFVPGMFSCQVVWVTTFTLHSRLRSGGGKTAFARGIQQLRSALTAFEVAERKNMFVYRDALGNVFYMRFYRGVDVLEGNTSGSPPKTNMDSTSALAEDCQDSELQSIASESSSINRFMIKRTRTQDSESEKGRDDPCDGILALKVHGIVPAGEEIKEKLVQSLRNKLDDAVLEILCVTLKRNPHCKLTPDDVHFLQQPRSKPDNVFKFKLPRFIVAGHLPAFSYYLHQNLLQFLSMPKYTSVKTKYHFQDYSRLQDQEAGEGSTGGGGDSSVYLYNQSPGGGGTGNKGIAVVSMALVDRYGGFIRNPEWKQPDIGTIFDVVKFKRLVETSVLVGNEEELNESFTDDGNGTSVMVEFNMWKQGRINVELLKSHLDQAIKQAGWDLIMEFKVLTAPLAASNQTIVEDESVFMDDIEESGSTFVGSFIERAAPIQSRRRSSHLNPGTTRSNSTSGQPDQDDEPRTRSMSFTGLRKNVGENEEAVTQLNERERVPSPVPLHSQGRGNNEGSRPRLLLSRSQSTQLSLSPLEVGEAGTLHKNYSDLLDSWIETGKNLGVPSLRRIVIPLNCRYPVACLVQEVEKIINQVAPDITARQFWRPNDAESYVSYVSGQSGSVIGGCTSILGSAAGASVASTTIGGRRDSGGGGCASVNWGTDEYSLHTSEHNMFKRHEMELLSLENTEEAEYPIKILSLFRKNENFQPGGSGNTCFLIARNLAHWKSCVRGDAEFSLHSAQDFKNFYKFPPLLNENFDVDGSRGSIEKLSRSNFSRGDFLLWSSAKGSGPTSSIPILIPRQRFLRAKVTSSEVDFVVYNWSKECCERLQEQITFLSQWIQARSSLLSSLLLQKSGLFYCQPILPDNFACSDGSTNPFIMGDVDLKELITHSAPIGKVDRRSHHFHTPAPVGGGMSGGGPGAMSRLMSKLGMTVPGGPATGGNTGSSLVSSSVGSKSGLIVSGGIPPSAISKPAQAWTDFYRNISLFNLLMKSDPIGENPVDAHGRQLLNMMNAQVHTKDPENTFFQYWLTRGPSASNVITTQMLESFTKTARTIHFCLTPVMFLPTWRAAIAQTRDSSSVGGLIRRNRVSSRRFLHPVQVGPSSNKLALPPSATSVLASQRMRHGSEASQASSLASLRNRSKSYHSGMMNLFPPPEVISEKDFESGGSLASIGPSSQLLQQESLFSKVKADEPWHGVVCKIFLQEYMQYLQTLGFVPVHCKASGTCTPTSPGAPPSGSAKSPETRPKNKRSGPPPRSTIRGDSPVKTKPGNSGKAAKSSGVGSGTGSPTQTDGDGFGEDDERMIHFLQRCLQGGIMVIEVGLVPPFLYCKIHALEAKRIFPIKPNKNQNKATTKKNAIQFVDECEKMKVLTHLHSFMYDFHLRAMFLYISGRQQLFKVGYHITTFLDDFITYYPKCPNFSRNAVHIGMVTLEEVMTPSQVLFNYILGHDKYYRMKVIRMAPFNPVTGCSEENSSEYVLVHSMSRKVSYRSVSERSSGEIEPEQPQQSQDEFDLTLVIAHDFPSSSRDFLPSSQGLRVKYYIVLTSRRELYPKGDTNNEFNAGKLCPVSTPSLLCSRFGLPSCTVGSLGSGTAIGGTGSYSKLLSPPAPPPSYFDGFEGHLNAYSQYPLQHHSSMTHHSMTPKARQITGNTGGGPYSASQQAHQGADMIREEKVRYMGYFSSHEQLMQKIIDEQKDTMEQFIRQLITKAAVDCRRDLLWQRLLIGCPPQAEPKSTKGSISRSNKSPFSSTSSIASPLGSSIKEDLIIRETMSPISYLDFKELLELVQIVPLNKMDTRLEDLLCQPIAFYQTLIKVLMASSTASLGVSQPHPSFNYSEFISPDHLIHRLAIYTPDAHKSILMVEVDMEKVKCDIYVVVKDGKKIASQQKQPEVIPPFCELGDGMYTLVEKVVNACCYTTWATLI